MWSKLAGIYVLVIIICAVLAEVIPQPNNALARLALLILVLPPTIALWIALPVLVHELGHAIIALLLNMEICLIDVEGFRLRLKPKISISKLGPKHKGGMVFAVPRKPISIGAYRLYVISGCLTNLVVGSICLLFLVWDDSWAGPLIFQIGSQFLVLCLNLKSEKLADGHTTDGYDLIMSFRQPQLVVESFYKVTRQQLVRPRDRKFSEIKSKDTPVLVCNRLIYNSNNYLDQGELVQCNKCWQQAWNIARDSDEISLKLRVQIADAAMLSSQLVDGWKESAIADAESFLEKHLAQDEPSYYRYLQSLGRSDFDMAAKILKILERDLLDNAYTPQYVDYWQDVFELIRSRQASWIGPTKVFAP